MFCCILTKVVCGSTGSSGTREPSPDLVCLIVTVSGKNYLTDHVKSYQFYMSW